MKGLASIKELGASDTFKVFLKIMNENRPEQVSTWGGPPHGFPEDYLLRRPLKAALKMFSICLKAASQSLPSGGTDLFLGGAGWGK